MKFEESFSGSEKKELEVAKMRERVTGLSKKDNHYEASIYDLASSEDAHRELLKKRGIGQTELLTELGDIHSDEVLGRMEAEKEKWVDKMTGLKSKNAFNDEFLSFLKLEHRTGQNCVLFMLDFDHFKRVNDEHGHQAGDEALQQIAKIISETIRSSDVAYRYGGEEFAVILPGESVKGAELVAERIRKNVEEAIIAISSKNGDEVKLKKTISLGVASTENLDIWRQSDKELSNDVVKEQIVDVLVKNADRALYRAKNEGRNQVVVFNEKAN